MPKRESNLPKRRIAAFDAFDETFFEQIKTSVRYSGTANHKKRWADYGFDRPANPRPSKSLCDGRRQLLKGEAEKLFSCGVELRMVSSHVVGEFPKYVWAVDADGEPYEAKLGDDGRSYHGYRLGEDERAMRKRVIEEWKSRR